MIVAGAQENLQPKTDAVSSMIERRARATKGTSGDPIYRMVADEISRRGVSGALYDVGCGTGALRAYVGDLPLVKNYVGVDIVRYESFPLEASFVAAPLDQFPWPIEDAVADITCCVETVEHLENPRALFRELKRITRIGGVIVVTTPNQLSLISKLTFLLKNQFNAFQERPGLYPSHITALLEIDMIRIARETGLVDATIRHGNLGRLPGTPIHWPAFFGGRHFCDNVLISAINERGTALG